MEIQEQVVVRQKMFTMETDKGLVNCYVEEGVSLSDGRVMVTYGYYSPDYPSDYRETKYISAKMFGMMREFEFHLSKTEPPEVLCVVELDSEGKPPSVDKTCDAKWCTLKH